MTKTSPILKGTTFAARLQIPPSSSLKDDKDARACRPQMHLITHCLVLRFLGERDRGEGRKAL